MSENTKIEWCDHTLNPWEGCQKVGPGCDHCYAEARNARFSGGQATNWGPGAPRRRTSASNWKKPLAWNASHAEFFAKHGRRQRVFCASLADVFDNEVPVQWRADLFRLIRSTPHLDWLLLTKRIGNARSMIDEARDFDALGPVWPWPNVWIGTTITNQAEADRDIPKLLAVPARVRFLSIEPLLGPVDLRFHIFSEPTGSFRTYHGKRQMELRKPADGGLHWVIVGGESGPGARPMHPDWARSIRDQCQAADVPFLFKQWGEWAPCDACEATTGDAMYELLEAGRYCVVGHEGETHPANAAEVSQPSKPVYRAGKKTAGRILDGRTWNEFPETKEQ